MKKILLIDNYDSFTYNIFHSLSELGARDRIFGKEKASKVGTNTPVMGAEKQKKGPQILTQVLHAAQQG